MHILSGSLPNLGKISASFSQKPNPNLHRRQIAHFSGLDCNEPRPKVLRLFKHEDDIGWDARDLWANVLTHSIVHALYLFAKKNLPNHYVQNLVFLYRSVFNVSDKSQRVL